MSFNYSALQQSLSTGTIAINGVVPINKLFNLSESQLDNISSGDKFIYVESNNIPLNQFEPTERQLANCTNPLTGKRYEGIYLDGIFADLENYPNNNNRIYSIPEYLELLHNLKNQIYSKKGVFGELEHPSNSRYSVNANKVSHKLLDVDYNPNTQKVHGSLVLMKTPKGKIAREIVETGGLLATSARAAGETEKMQDGTVYCVVKLLTTYDIVTHPGFASALVDINKQLTGLEESVNPQIIQNNNGFSGILFEKDLNMIDRTYSYYISLNESVKDPVTKRPSGCFYKWLFENKDNLNLGLKNLNENNQNKQKIYKKTTNPIDSEASNLDNLNQLTATDKDTLQPETETQKTQKVSIDKNKDKNLDSEQQQNLQNSKSSGQDKVKNKLSKSVDEDLKESLNESKQTFFNQAFKSNLSLKKSLQEQKAQRRKRLIKRESASYFDGAAGFLPDSMNGAGETFHSTVE